jgi:hypothetical protein
MEAAKDVTFYVSILIFVSVSLVESYVLLMRRLRLDPSALITLSLYFIVMLIRFIRSMVQGNIESPAQIGISLSCHTLISMSMYFFVFEMKSVQIQIQAKTLLEFD